MSRSGQVGESLALRALIALMRAVPALFTVGWLAAVAVWLLQGGSSAPWPLAEGGSVHRRGPAPPLRRSAARPEVARCERTTRTTSSAPFERVHGLRSRRAASRGRRAGCRKTRAITAAVASSPWSSPTSTVGRDELDGDGGGYYQSPAWRSPVGAPVTNVSAKSGHLALLPCPRPPYGRRTANRVNEGRL
jgi:hypothetical protein